MVTEHTGIHGHLPAYVFDDEKVLILAEIHKALSYKESIDLLEQLIDLRVVIYWIFREVYLSRPRSLVIGINAPTMPSIPDGPVLRKLLDTKIKWKEEADCLLFREGKKPLRNSGMSEASKPTSVVVSATGEPMFNLPMKTYAAAAMTQDSNEGGISQEVITTMRQQFGIYSQKINQQEERLVRAEQRNMELTSQMEDLKSITEDLRSVTTQTRLEVQTMSSENKQEITTLTRHVLGHESLLQRILQAVEGRGPEGGENKNI
jgi:hypothetical protein